MNSGHPLLTTLIEATGLPTELVGRELQRLIVEKNVDPNHVTLQDIREILVDLLQSTFEVPGSLCRSDATSREDL